MADPQALDTRPPVQWKFPGQADPAPPAGPGALQTGAPPSVTTGVTTQQAEPAFDDEGTYQQAETDEESTYAKNILDAGGRKPLMEPLGRHPEQDKLDEARQLYSEITNPKEAKYFEPRIRALERKINADAAAQERRVRQQRTDQLRQIDAPRTTPKALAETGALMQSEIDTVASGYEQKRTSRDPKTARQADYNTITSPLGTMSEVGPDGKVTGYAPLRNAVTALSSLNRLPSNDLAVQYALTIGSPVGTDDNGKPLAGANGVKGKGATKYKVLGQDARENYLLEMPDGRVLRIDPTTFRALRAARIKGYAAGQKWEADQKEKNKPGVVERTIKALIPEKGF